MFLNLDLVGYKSESDLQVLSKRIQSFNRPLKIVDIGSSTGIATWHLAKNAPPGSVVHAIDPWRGEDINSKKNWFCRNWDPSVRNSKDYFLQNIADCNNVVPVQGKSPDCWSGELVDFVFLDLDCGPEATEKIVENNLVYWQKHLLPGGILAGYHYAPRTHPDSETTKLWYRRPVQKHARLYNCQIENPDNTWLWFLVPQGSNDHSIISAVDAGQQGSH